MVRVLTSERDNNNSKSDGNLKISIIVPCFNEESVIAQTIDRLNQLSLSLNNFGLEFIYVNDGSTDGTCRIIENAAKGDARIRLINFSRNFGHQIAITAGMDASLGDAVVLIDADLQDPPEVVLEMVAKWQEGYDVVYGTRIERLGESKFKLFTAKLFYRLINALSDTFIPPDTGDFRLMSRRVVDALGLMPERDRFVRGMVSWVGFKQIALPYKRKERFAGESKYPFRKMFKFAVDGILSFSTKPLQIALGLGIFAAFCAMLGIVYAVAMRIFGNDWVTGWTALIISVLFMGGVQLICLGVIGEYVGRIYNACKNRPLYLIDGSVAVPFQLSKTIQQPKTLNDKKN